MIAMKDGVDWRGVHPALWYKLALANEKHAQMVSNRLTVTSLRRPFLVGARLTKHTTEDPREFVLAADMRRWDLDRFGMTIEFCRWMQVSLNLGVMLEPEWLTVEQIAERGGVDAIDAHIHTQLRLPSSDIGFEFVA
jgi:hypothetical protein